VRRVVGLVTAAALVVSSVSGCGRTNTAPADAAYGTYIGTSTPQGLRAKQTMDMVNSDWPIGDVNVRTMAVEDQVVAIFLGTKGHLDSVPPGDVSRFETELLEHVKASHSEILTGIKESKKLSEEAEENLVKVVNDFKKGFSATDGSSVVVNEADAEALDPEDLEKESVKVRKPAPKKA
jgi:hypothetical protein